MAKLKDKLIEAADRVWRAYLKYGPVDDGRPEGDEFEAALMHLRARQRATKLQTGDERAALVALLNALGESGVPHPARVAAAIEAANRALREGDVYHEGP